MKASVSKLEIELTQLPFPSKPNFFRITYKKKTVPVKMCLKSEKCIIDLTVFKTIGLQGKGKPWKWKTFKKVYGNFFP